MGKQSTFVILLLVGIATVAVIAYALSQKDNADQKPKQQSTQTLNQNSTMTPPQNSPFEVLKEENIKGKTVKISTNKGNITIQLNEKAPIASSNFIALIGKGFYNNLTFHRRVEGFVIQGGDPDGNGTGGPGYKFADEPPVGDYKRGTVAMANSGPDTNGSQFFIVLEDQPTLPKAYTIFGTVTTGMDVADKITVGDVMTNVTLK